MSRLLSNSAAEFTEHRVAPLLLNSSDTDEQGQSNGPAFVSALDSFFEKGEAPK